MIIYISMKMSEDYSVHKQGTLEMINLVLEDTAIEASLLSAVAEPRSILICDPDEIMSGHRSLHTFH